MTFTDDHLTTLVDPGLGNSAYLVDLGDGRGLAVDASRDLRALYRAARSRGLRVAFAADTHLHADFLSGALQLASDEGATVLASAAGNRDFAHTPLRDGDELDLGGLTLRALATPGHTDEHLSYLLRDGSRELGVFTGGSLLVGSAARTDLLGAHRTEELARAQYRSLRRLTALPDSTAVWPTHGAGSFCSAPPGAERTTTIGAQKQHNALLAAADEDAFVAALLGSLGSRPAYFDRLGEINRRGPALLDGPPRPAPLSVGTVRTLLGQGAWLVDVRPVADFAAGHVPGAVSLPLREQFATWLGWLLPWDVPLVFVLGPGQDADDVGRQAAKIGYDRVAGHLAGGMDAWVEGRGPVRTVELVTAGEIGDRPVLDVRQQPEYAAGHLPGAAHTELGSPSLHTVPVTGASVVMCGHGERAMTAASLLGRGDAPGPAVLTGGPHDWSRATGRPLEEGA
ncbi:rhodanese-like domain-containing protein [Streptomyces sp. ACA25]|uniref:MBL fold metallo-hydrolase n=1 Tax=Streptomyces sp. ACA25 TaxID=3022596 RepID=UPI002307466D|nr:rhodanese-like domain-containing protein [Streptomyces sp. ACA25]MDB1086411.1 rhodanese-like domain-containing protein [Streptomyces sp. ACA25]